jgi:DNA-binding PadR family transcriptional regulator
MRSEEQFAWAGPPGWGRGKPPWMAMGGSHGGHGGHEGDEGERGRRGGPFAGPGAGFGGPPGWGAWGGWAGRGRGGRGGRARRGDVRAAVLLLLEETPRNGYQIIQELAERSRGAWRPSPGSVYPVLQQLEDEGLVVSSAADVGRMYRITDAGTAYVESHRAEMGVPWEEAANTVSQPAMEFAQLVPQLLGAVKQVMHAGNDRQIAQAITVLTEARRGLYRILAEDAPAGGAEGSDRADGSGRAEGSDRADGSEGADA